MKINNIERKNIYFSVFTMVTYVIEMHTAQKRKKELKSMQKVTKNLVLYKAFMRVRRTWNGFLVRDS